MSDLIANVPQPALAVWLIKATALLIAALIATSLLRRASAGTRHLVWVGALASILFLPALSWWAPVRLAILPTAFTQSVLPKVMTSEASVEPSLADAVTGMPAPPARQQNVSARPRSASRAIGAVPNETTVPFWTLLLGFWGAVSLTLIGWLAFGASSVRRIVRSGRSLDEVRAWSAPLCEIADRLDLDTVPRLLASDRVEMPFACGVLQPTIVLPATAEEWSDSRRRAVLFHELAHVKRRDLLGHTLGRLACALYWFHPLVWTAARRLRAESERACDDLVLSCGARASDYADHLLDIVISVRHYGAPATAMPMARRRELEGRVLAILDPAVQRIGPGRLQSLGMAATLGVLALSVAAIAPRRAAGDVQPARHVARGDSTTTAPAMHNESVRRLDAKPMAAGTRSTIAMVEAPTASVSAATAAPIPVPSPAPAGGATPRVTIDDSSISMSLGPITSTVVRAAASAVAGAASNAKLGREPGADSAKVALLLRVLRTDRDASVRRMAAWGLNEAGDSPEVVAALADALRRDDDPSVREMAAWALSDSRRGIARRALAEAVQSDESDEVRETAAWALGNSGDEEERGVLEAALTSDPSEHVRETAAWGLGYAPRRPAAHALVVALRDKNVEVRESAAWALAETEDEDTAPAISEAFLRETNIGVRTAELRALIAMHVEDKDVLDAALSSKDAELRARAVRMLAGAGGGSWPEPRPRPRPRPMP